MSNARYQKHFKTVRGNVWAFYEAQTPETREWFQNFPLDLWPGNSLPITQWGRDDAARKHLAGLEAVWGPDHPAVQDAKRQVVVQRGKLMAALQADDLEDLF